MSVTLAVDPGAVRTEHDLLGKLDIVADAYYGIHTARALANFPISGIPLARFTELVRALAAVKRAAAMANLALGGLSRAKADAIAAACVEIEGGALHDQFCVDVMQGGAGTSTNMVANEVIANRGLELLGRERGEYAYLHPLEDVNLGQSTNDVYPTALRIAVRWLVDDLQAKLAILCTALREQAHRFADLPKLGRTQLQDAVPMTLGQEFGAWEITLAEEDARLAEAKRLLCEVNLGGSAIGTSLNVPPDYPQLVCEYLARATDIPVVLSENLIEATSDAGVFVAVSSAVKRAALKISKICNDLRLLASGPLAGFGEINLPPVQCGSSIMPGKINPVIPEAVNQIAFDVVGSDLTVTMAASAGQLQLNAFEPVIAVALFRSIRQLGAGCELLATRCVSGITANPQTLRRNTGAATGILTALVPHLGYEAATALSVEAKRDHRAVEDIVVARGLATNEELRDLMGRVRAT